MRPDLLAPEPLSAQHAVTDFCCGEPSLDDWIRRRALTNHRSGASRTFVTADRNARVFGYYALAAGAIARHLATSGTRRNMPDPIPVMVLGRLAVDQQAQGMQVGGALLQDAVRRTRMVAQQVGVRALLVHALNENAQRFYQQYGFQASPYQPMTLMLRL
ncbi:GNAT family N-acetyltransferase [Lamprobacter modestohalophilus]|uniref:GNAT family N-acetyltransferase n=1 Tax=Lamprobacter modestohalophilus TaxID=1064514 RepID=UPI002ADEAD06|nr:GNAT family N-acetyltransferase [Lamprobacter modestohalophilus]MEA1048738.1 GNAT family N-acetyltransferase [Lamprobacter modestohalophilus]